MQPCIGHPWRRHAARDLPRLVDRPEGRDGRDRPRALRLRPRPHGRQPADLPRPRGAQPLRRLPARVPARRGHLDRPRRCCSSRSGSTSGPPCADARELARPAGRLPRVAGARVDLRLAHDGLERAAAPALHRLPPRCTSRSGSLRPGFVEGDVYHNVVVGFSNPFVSAFYIVAMLALGLHLYHGVWSMLQTLGLVPPALERAARARSSPVLAGIVVARQHLVPARRARRLVHCRGPPWSSTPTSPRARSRRSGSKHRFEMKLVNPANKRKYTRHRGRHRPGRRRRRGLAGRARLQRQVPSASRTSPRRAHSIAAQGGINAAKNYQNDGDSVYRLFYDTVKGGDFRAREANVYRLAELSVNIIDQCVAQGVPFAREYGGTARQPLVRRRAGLAHVLRARPDRPAAAARRLPGARAAGRARAA